MIWYTYTHWYDIHINPKLHNYSLSLFLPPVNMVCSLILWVCFCFVNKVHVCHMCLDFTCKWYHTIFIFINTQESVASLYINNKISEREIQTTIPFAIASNRIKYLGINLPKDTKHLYSKNSKSYPKDTNETNWRWHKKIEWYTMFLNRKNQYCQNDYTVQGNLQN